MSSPTTRSTAACSAALSGWALWLSLVVCCPEAVAQPAAAEALFRAGRQAAERGEHTQACEKFRESYRLEAAVGTLFNIALCEEALSQLSRAWEHLQEALHALPADDSRRKHAAERLRALDARLPRITVELASTAPPDTRVAVAGVTLAGPSFGVPLPIDPGPCLIEVDAPGHEPRRYPIELAEATRLRLTVEPGPPRALPAPKTSAAPPPSATAPQGSVATTTAPQPAGAVPPRTASESPSLRRPLAHALLGAAAVGLIASAISAGFVIDRAATVADHCPSDVCDERGLLAAESGRAAFAVLLAAGTTTLVASGVAAYLLIDAQPSAERVAGGVSVRF